MAILIGISLCVALATCGGYFKDIRINTYKGLEVTIPASCMSWVDGCSLYCRVGPVEYVDVPTGRRCIQANIVDPKCMDDDPTSARECERVRSSYPNARNPE